MISHLKRNWQVLKYSTDGNFCSSSQNKTVLCILPILTNATTASMWPFPNELVLPVLLLSSRLSFPNDVKWTCYLIYTSITNTSEISWHQRYIKFRSVMTYVFLSSSVSTRNIYTYQTIPYFSPPFCYFGFGTHWSLWFDWHCTEQNQQQYQGIPLKGSSIFSSLKSSHFFLFINTSYFTTTWPITIKTSLFESLKYPLA